MENPNLFLENTLLLMAVLLFLAVLPRALRQKKKTELDRAVERFEKEELQAAAEKKSNENNTRRRKHMSPKDHSLAYLVEDLPTSKQTEEYEGIPPFPSQEEERENEVKIVKEGVPISHSEVADPPPASKKKDTLIRQEFSIAPDANKAPSKNAPSEPLIEKKDIPTVKDHESTGDEDFGVSSIIQHENEAPDDNWIEAEIPGLTIEPPHVPESPESIPTFKASSKAKPPSKAEKSQKSSKKEIPGMKIKNLTPNSEEKMDSKPKKQVEKRTDSLELEMEISEPKPKSVEINAPVVSHKNIGKKEPKKNKTGAPSSEAGKSQEARAEGTAVPPQQEQTKTSSEKAKPKPFLLDLKYLDEEGLATENSIPQEKLSAESANVMISRLKALQVDLEDQLVSITGELTPGGNPVNGSIRKDQSQDSLSDLKETINESSDKKEVSLKELDSFLYTATQRKNRE